MNSIAYQTRPRCQAYPNEKLRHNVMPEQYRYTLPVKAGEQRLLGELTGAACATLVAGKLPNATLYWWRTIAPDMQNALRLHDEISQFTDQMVMNLADWETLPYTSFVIRTLSPAFHPLPATDDAAWRTDCSGEMLLSAFAHTSSLTVMLVMKRSAPVTRCITTQLDSAGYRHVDQVLDTANTPRARALLDLFPMGELPYRSILMMKSTAWRLMSDSQRRCWKGK